ncbi:MAG TPA: cytochrome c oxidase assembly protein [Stellaceae bacterium]|jgi:cytochrome c oxidase assembly protein subunit 11|nr:cytochrome c oxidase assembly protein [Stellaceae bacterium]
MTAAAPPRKPNLRRDVTVAAICGAVAAMMVGAAYASVPLYNWFCRTTGFGGTTQVAVAAPGQVLGRMIKVRFDSNVAPGLAWKFAPEQNEINIHIGEVATVHYKVTNMAAREITAQAGYNVAPPQVGAYFTKINCFCFTQQTMKAGETREMTVVFYVDPSLVKDGDQERLDTITLSYTFYRIPNPEKPVAEAPTAAGSEKL